jgi:phosphoglycerate dehydrogenase-like enzyme
LIEVHAMADLGDWLPRADWVIDILPAASDTAGFFDGARFAAMKPGSIFINIGRGATVDQTALLAALRGHLRAAYLDVTTPEPLPPEHPLWTAPNCILTPHVAGGHEDENDRLWLTSMDSSTGRRSRGGCIESLLSLCYWHR